MQYTIFFKEPNGIKYQMFYIELLWKRVEPGIFEDTSTKDPWISELHLSSDIIGVTCYALRVLPAMTDVEREQFFKEAKELQKLPKFVFKHPDNALKPIGEAFKTFQKLAEEVESKIKAFVTSNRCLAYSEGAMYDITDYSGLAAEVVSEKDKVLLLRDGVVCKEMSHEEYAEYRCRGYSKKPSTEQYCEH